MPRSAGRKSRGCSQGSSSSASSADEHSHAEKNRKMVAKLFGALIGVVIVSVAGAVGLAKFREYTSHEVDVTVHLEPSAAYVMSNPFDMECSKYVGNDQAQKTPDNCLQFGSANLLFDTPGTIRLWKWATTEVGKALPFLFMDSGACPLIKQDAYVEWLGKSLKSEDVATFTNKANPYDLKPKKELVTEATLINSPSIADLFNIEQAERGASLVALFLDIAIGDKSDVDNPCWWFQTTVMGLGAVTDQTDKEEVKNIFARFHRVNPDLCVFADQLPPNKLIEKSGGEKDRTKDKLWNSSLLNQPNLAELRQKMITPLWKRYANWWELAVKSKEVSIMKSACENPEKPGQPWTEEEYIVAAQAEKDVAENELNTSQNAAKSMPVEGRELEVVDAPTFLDLCKMHNILWKYAAHKQFDGYVSALVSMAHDGVAPHFQKTTSTHPFEGHMPEEKWKGDRWYFLGAFRQRKTESGQQQSFHPRKYVGEEAKPDKGNPKAPVDIKDIPLVDMKYSLLRQMLGNSSQVEQDAVFKWDGDKNFEKLPNYADITKDTIRFGQPTGDSNAGTLVLKTAHHKVRVFFTDPGKDPDDTEGLIALRSALDQGVVEFAYIVIVGAACEARGRLALNILGKKNWDAQKFRVVYLNRQNCGTTNECMQHDPDNSGEHQKAARKQNGDVDYRCAITCETHIPDMEREIFMGEKLLEEKVDTLDSAEFQPVLKPPTKKREITKFGALDLNKGGKDKNQKHLQDQCRNLGSEAKPYDEDVKEAFRLDFKQTLALKFPEQTAANKIQVDVVLIGPMTGVAEFLQGMFEAGTVKVVAGEPEKPGDEPDDEPGLYGLSGAVFPFLGTFWLIVSFAVVVVALVGIAVIKMTSADGDADDADTDGESYDSSDDDERRRQR